MSKRITLHLKAVREARGLTQAQAGARVGVVRRTWFMWENGFTRPRDEATYRRLYEAFDGEIVPGDFVDLPVLATKKAA